MPELRQNEEVKINESEGAQVLSSCAASVGHVLGKGRWSQPGDLAARPPEIIFFLQV